MVDAHSTDPLAPQYVDPSTLERQAPPPVVTYKKDEDAAAGATCPSGIGEGEGREGWFVRAAF